MAKSAAFAPVTIGFIEKVSGAPPLFDRITDMGELVEFWGTFPNAKGAGGIGFRDTTGTVPVPVTVMDWLVGEASSEKVSVVNSCMPAVPAAGV